MEQVIVPLVSNVAGSLKVMIQSGRYRLDNLATEAGTVQISLIPDVTKRILVVPKYEVVFTLWRRQRCDLAQLDMLYFIRDKHGLYISSSLGEHNRKVRVYRCLPASNIRHPS